LLKNLGLPMLLHNAIYSSARRSSGIVQGLTPLASYSSFSITERAGILFAGECFGFDSLTRFGQDSAIAGFAVF